MSIGVVDPRVLLLLLAVPLIGVALRRRRGHWPAAALRAGAAAGLVLVLAGAYLQRARPAGGACVVLAVDVSASVRRAGVDAAAGVLPALSRALGPHDLVGAVAFADGARVVVAPSPDPLPPAALVAAAGAAGLDAGASDLAAGLMLAAAICPDGTQPAVLLFSDGRETRGSALAEAALFEPRVPVFPMRIDPAALPPASLRRVLAPRQAPDRTIVPLEVVVESHAPAPVEATLETTADDEAPVATPATLLPGLTVVALPHRTRGAGRHTLEVALRVPPEEPPLPGAIRLALDVTDAPSVLIVATRPTSVVATALAERGMRAALVPPGELAQRLARLATDTVVVLDDVAHAEAPPGTAAALERWVARGGALVATGGPHLFGDPAWADSALAPLLPVELVSQAPEPKEREPIALMLVIDRSNSMGFSTRPDPVGEGEKMEYARRAALAVLDQLGPNDLVGAIAFDSQPYELGRLVRVADGRAALAARIRALRHGGGTDFKEALEMARAQLLAVDRPVRHVILLTDGDTNRRSDDHQDLIAGLARDGVTLTAIRIGSDTGNIELLEQFARATGGEFHHVPDATALPQLMIRDTRRLIDAPGSLVNAPVRIGAWGPMLAGLREDDFPRAARWAATRLKPDGELRLHADAGSRHDPLLATWQYELGRVAVLTLDFHSGAAEWAGWDGFAKLWTQIVLWALPSTDAGAPGAADDGAGRELRATGSDATFLRRLAGATGGAVDPPPATVAAARPGTTHQRTPLAPWLVPLVILALLGDVALRERPPGPRGRRDRARRDAASR